MFSADSDAQEPCLGASRGSAPILTSSEEPAVASSKGAAQPVDVAFASSRKSTGSVLERGKGNTSRATTPRPAGRKHLSGLQVIRSQDSTGPRLLLPHRRGSCKGSACQCAQPTRRALAGGVSTTRVASPGGCSCSKHAFTGNCMEMASTCRQDAFSSSQASTASLQFSRSAGSKVSPRVLLSGCRRIGFGSSMSRKLNTPPLLGKSCV
mmetsp:Transcript_29562/g.70308  ORF Transcript_29562/g.70308 Transcript_29562/m.70308 type:complete len:209 (+) Transcript_29562:406-1032(+)